MNLATLLDGVSCDAVTSTQLESIAVRGMTLDSRKVMHGDVFFALFGKNHDGRDYIDVAIERGAVAVLADAGDQYQGLGWAGTVPVIAIEGLRSIMGRIAAHFFAWPSLQVPVIGVTGTNGKTSCTQFTAQVLQGLQHSCGVVGTLGFGIYPELQDTGFTTPDAIDLQSALADLVDGQVETVAMEVSSQGLHQHRLSGVRFYSAVFTNLTRDHLDYHGSMLAYAQEKRKLFEHEHLKAAIVNHDDPWAVTMLNALPRQAESLTYSLADKRADIHARRLSFHAEGYRAFIHTPWGEGEIKGRLLGAFNFSNALAALGAVMTLPSGYSFDDVLAQISGLKPVAGRMELIGSAAGTSAVVDYAHTPDGLQSALQAVREHSHGKVWCVFGCGGNRDQGKRPLMAEVAEQFADQIIVTDDNPRHENADDIVRQILLGFTDSSRVSVERDRAQAIRTAIAAAEEGDVVLIAGKGHESYQDVAGQRMAFSDTAQARLALQAKIPQNGHKGGEGS